MDEDDVVIWFPVPFAVFVSRAHQKGWRVEPCWYNFLDILCIDGIAILGDDVSRSDVDKVVKGGVDGDVVALSMLLKIQFLIDLIVVTAFGFFSCDKQ
jgi:hypothetical protein